MARAASVYGSNNIDRLFPDQAPMAPVPWERASRRKAVQDYDPERVRAVLVHPDRHEVVDMDPRELHATQPAITRQGVSHYLENDYRVSGRTFADHGNAGNRTPIVYSREGQNMILSGHHRAAASLLQGQQFRALRIEGPWGPPR